MANQGPQSEEVEAALGRLLAWPEIARSPQLAAFLDYIVRRTLRNEATAIKAYAIAVDVLGRPSGFDPQSDPIVRVQARRLRSLLDHYYSADGQDERVRIELPVGRYVPEFVVVGQSVPLLLARADDTVDEAGPAAPARPRHRRRRSVAIAALTAAGILAIVAVLAFLVPHLGTPDPLSETATRPSLAIKEFENLTGDPSAVSLSAGLALELVTDLEQFETLTVSYSGSGTPVGAVDATPDFVLNGIVRMDEGKPQYSVILSDPTQNDVVWTRIISLSAAEADRPDVLDSVSGILSRELGSFRGPLHANARALVQGRRSLAGMETLYRCRMAFDAYRETSSTAAGEKAQSCFAALDEETRQRGVALAAEASLLVELSGGTMADAAANEASRLLDEAQQVSPTNSFVWEQRARLEERRGRHDAAEAAYNSALQLNPSNLDAIAARARHLAFLGRVSQGAALARVAIEGAPPAPPWYHAALVLERFDAGEFDAALASAELYARADAEVGPVLAVMAAQRLGRRETVSRYLAQVMDTDSFRRLGVVAQLRRRLADPTRLSAMRQSLLDAGVPMQALYSAF
ncbi:hypothetical protein IC608_00300 [Devosia sp. PTR5]|uniref:Tetratricopeptide repeat protein n=1 Tax=Devosia oryzisoli TaxID=2774138 RepID=A0A927FS28_9HYPH|nr:tetratricopeptide repeat protein [Devosia oryzisoli]MBD8063913.1 hypothetical protein [Devosia oryzisoli]